MKYLHLYAGMIGSAVALVIVVAFTLTFLQGVQVGATEAAKMLKRPAPLTHEQIRQAAWEAQNPCDGKIRYWKIRTKDYPTPEACEQHLAHEAEKEAKIERSQLLDRMAECVTETDPHYFEDEHNHIDTVENPRYHYSWVLGGECEQMAHDVERVFGLCDNYVDDDPESAEYCRLEVNAYRHLWCSRSDLTDDERRDCAQQPPIDYSPWTSPPETWRYPSPMHRAILKHLTGRFR